MAVTLNLIRSYLRRLPQRTRSIIATCVFGLAAGGAAVAFQRSISILFAAAYGSLARQSTAVFLCGSFAVIMGSSLIVGFLLNSFCSQASGSGIPQLKLAFWKDFGYVPWRVVWVKFVAGFGYRRAHG
jgi:CIC family chloride channel protein